MIGEMESIAVDQADIMERLVKMNRRLIEELAQYRVMDEEERELQGLLVKMGGGHNVGLSS